ncbi:hypothetical protein E2F43_14655 [Seongchinamella unica]|uniref:LNS2/PITP domain-containing protein n=1 Tax=Seongchinamella unica TaxID=2547392 RepID=A0A4R5LQJ2_9GAMM|nr:hypothetical protein [Seongchinamella unica]TDG12800.1 hypothetical protein E2F43_14655 [Seongchinamella unica]
MHILSHLPVSARACLALVLAVMTVACSPAPLPTIPAASDSAQRLVVFDVDGTLTPGVFSAVLPREHAAEAVDMLTENGLRVIYLSARFPWFSSRLAHWLSEHGFAEGPVFVAQSIADNRNPSRFKLAILEAFKREGWQFAAAYGDSSTDFAAYSDAGIPRERIFALKRSGEDRCEPGPWAECLDGWGDHIPFVASRLTDAAAVADLL